MKAITKITLERDISEQEFEAFKDLLKTPSLLEIVKKEYGDKLAEIFDDVQRHNINVEFEVEE